MRSLILILPFLMSGCMMNSSEAPRGDSGPKTLTLRLGMTPEQFIIENSDFGFRNDLPGAPQGTDRLHNLKLIPDGKGARAIVLPRLGGNPGNGTIVGFPPSIEVIQSTGEIVDRLSNAIFYPTEGGMAWQGVYTLREAHGDVIRVADALEAAGWEPVTFRYNNRPNAEPALGRVDWATFEAMWLNEPSSASALAAIYRSGNAEVSCSAGLRESDPPPIEAQFMDGRNPAGRAAFLASNHFGAVCGFGHVRERL